MDIITNFYVQGALCILTFVSIFFLVRSTDRLKDKLDEKIKK